MKTLKKSIESSRSVVEELFYKTAFAYLHDKMNKTLECKEILEGILERITVDKIFDNFLVQHFISSCKELSLIDMGVKLVEAKHNNNPDDQNTSLQLFDMYVSINDFMKMNATSMKIFNTFKLPEYQIHGIQSLYMLSQSGKGMPNTIDLALMFANIHMQKYTDEDKVFP